MTRLIVTFEEVDGESIKHIDRFELSTTEFRLLNNFLSKLYNNLYYMQDLFGSPRTGIHSYRLFDFAIIDVLLTFIFAYFISNSYINTDCNLCNCCIVK